MIRIENCPIRNAETQVALYAKAHGLTDGEFEVVTPEGMVFHCAYELKPTVTVKLPYRYLDGNLYGTVKGLLLEVDRYHNQCRVYGFRAGRPGPMVQRFEIDSKLGDEALWLSAVGRLQA